MLELDSVKINFDSGGLWVLNIALAVVMFGVALGITFDDFKGLLKQPKLVILGIVSQFVLLPFVTFLVMIFLYCYFIYFLFERNTYFFKKNYLNY